MNINKRLKENRKEALEIISKVRRKLSNNKLRKQDVDMPDWEREYFMPNGEISFRRILNRQIWGRNVDVRRKIVNT